MIQTLCQIFDYKNVVYLFWAVAILMGLTVGGSILIAYEAYRQWKGRR